MERNKKLEFWNSRAQYGKTAGSNDFILKDIEINLLLNKVKNNSSVLDIGCGNGDTLIKLAEINGCYGLGVDFANEMVRIANEGCKKSGVGDKIKFLEGALPGLPGEIGDFNYAITQRCLINLDSVQEQYDSFKNIMSHLTPDGYYLMIESSIQGLERTNELRKLLDLDIISPPWHNLFLDEEIVESWSNREYYLEEVVPFESTYHFLSRVIYAAIAKKTGEELKYDSDINLLALKLPSIGNFGPVKMWVWRKK